MGRYKKIDVEEGDIIKNENGISYIVVDKEEINHELEEIKYRYGVISEYGWHCWVYDIYQGDKEGEIFWSHSTGIGTLSKREKDVVLSMYNGK